MKKLDNIKSIIIIRSGALGDTVYATSILDALKAQYGETTKIDWIGAPSASSLFKHDPRVNQVFIIKHRKFPIYLSLEKRRIISYTKKHPYDLLINLESNGPKFNPLAKAIQATHKIGYPFTEPVLNTNSRHMVEYIKDYFAHVIEEEVLKNSYPKLFGSDYSSSEKKFSLPNKYIVINPSNSHTNRNKINYRAWPAEKWKALIHRLSQEKNLVLIGDKGEESYFDSLKPFNKNVIDLSGKTNLPELISVISHASSIITTDTGPAHIASAVNTLVHCLIGPTNPNSTGPYKTPHNQVDIISKNLDCSPCYYLPHIKTCTDNICMKDISVEDVLQNIQLKL